MAWSKKQIKRRVDLRSSGGLVDLETRSRRLTSYPNLTPSLLKPGPDRSGSVLTPRSVLLFDQWETGQPDGHKDGPYRDMFIFSEEDIVTGKGLAS